MMRTGRLLLAGTLGLGLIGLADLALVRLSHAWPADESPTGSSSQPGSSSPWQRSIVGANEIQLTFHFRHPDDFTREMSCTVRRSDYEREVASYGVADARRDAAVSRAFLQILDAKAASLGLGGCLKAEVRAGGGYGWKNLCDRRTMSPEEEQRIPLLNAWVAREARTKLHGLLAQYYRERGLILGAKKIAIDYAGIVDRATAPLADCFTVLRRLEVDDPRPLLGLFADFFQDLRYEVPPLVEKDGRRVFEFRVPTAVLVRGGGDCDSKAAAFCALWRQLPARALLILVPGHALVAVEGKPGPGQQFIRKGLRYFILCEVAGPGRVRPGMTRVSSSQLHIEIPPATPPARGEARMD